MRRILPFLPGAGGWSWKVADVAFVRILLYLVPVNRLALASSPRVLRGRALLSRSSRDLVPNALHKIASCTRAER